MEQATVVFATVSGLILIVVAALSFSSNIHRYTGLWLCFMAFVFAGLSGTCGLHAHWRALDLKDAEKPKQAADNPQDPNPSAEAVKAKLVEIEVRARQRSVRDPGLSINAFLRIRHSPLDRRKYIFDIKGNGKEGASVYISPDNIFTFSIVDSGGETHSLRAGTGSGGIPLNEPFFLTCEGGIGAQLTLLRILINGTELDHIELPFRMNFSGLDIRGAAIGSDLQGGDGGLFDLGGNAIFNATLPDADIVELRDHLSAPERTAGILFRGNQSLRSQKGSSPLQAGMRAQEPEFDPNAFGRHS